MFFLTVAAPPPGEDALLDTYISHIALGSQDALAALYQRTHAAAYGFALSILKNAHDAEDVLQDVYLQVWHGASGYRSHGKAMGWLMTITRNLALDRLRQRSRAQTLPHEEWQALPEEASPVTAEDRMILEALLSVLEDQEPPRPHRPQTRGDRRASGAAAAHGALQVQPGIEKTAPCMEGG